LIDDLFSTDTIEFLRLLQKHGVRYLVIGGAAVIYHGYARLTGDIDFLYDCAPDNSVRLWHALVEFWGGSVPAVADAKELADPDLVVQFGLPPNRIDLIASLPAVPFAAAWQHRVGVDLRPGRGSRHEQAPVQVWFIGLAELRAAKRDAGRPKDLDDLQHLPVVD
jgi:hypothetical protein